MTLLVATTWDSEPWVERFQSLMPELPVVVPGDIFDRRRVSYVAAWGPKSGVLSGLPALEVIFSLGAGVDHLMGYPDLPLVPIVRDSTSRSIGTRGARTRMLLGRTSRALFMSMTPLKGPQYPSKAFERSGEKL